MTTLKTTKQEKIKKKWYEFDFPKSPMSNNERTPIMFVLASKASTNYFLVYRNKEKHLWDFLVFEDTGQSFLDYIKKCFTPDSKEKNATSFVSSIMRGEILEGVLSVSEKNVYCVVGLAVAQNLQQSRHLAVYMSGIELLNVFRFHSSLIKEHIQSDTIFADNLEQFKNIFDYLKLKSKKYEEVVNEKQ